MGRIISMLKMRNWTLARLRTHQTTKPLECSGNARVRVDFNKNIVCGVNEDLEKSGFVEGTVEKGQKALLQRVSFGQPCVSIFSSMHDNKPGV